MYALYTIYGVRSTSNVTEPSGKVFPLEPEFDAIAVESTQTPSRYKKSTP